jgi:hypothetical protein
VGSLLLGFILIALLTLLEVQKAWSEPGCGTDHRNH